MSVTTLGYGPANVSCDSAPTYAVMEIYYNGAMIGVCAAVYTFDCPSMAGAGQVSTFHYVAGEGEYYTSSESTNYTDVVGGIAHLDAATWSGLPTASSDSDYTLNSPGGVITNIQYTNGGAVAPTVTSSAATTVTNTTATGNGNVTSDGGATITERGICWSTAANPTTANSKGTAAGTTGSYTVNITGLTANTLYHFRAYAINSAGTGYSSDLTFTTSAAGTVTINVLFIGAGF